MADRNLLFGVLALQLDLIDNSQFAEACAAWATRKDVPLADILRERGWLTDSDQTDVERLVERKLQRNKGGIDANLADTVRQDAQRLLNVLTDPSLNATLSGLSGSDDEPMTDAAPAQQTRDQYTLLRLHATGGIGRVWLARDATLGREVALKELRPDRVDDPSLTARFLTEGQVTGQLEHPGVVPVYALAKQDAVQPPYYTMRFIKGRTLTDAARAYHQDRAAGKAGMLRLRELLTDFVAVRNTLAYAHARGVIHRDLKGANIIIGDYGEVMVVDWGLAKLLGRSEEKAAAPVAIPSGASSEETLPGHIVGTPAYMSPEQATGQTQTIGPASDVYGLGAILYEILTGRPPFDGAEMYEVLRKVVQDAPIAPRRLCGIVPRALEAICLKALAKAPADRYASASDLARDVQRWLADEPVAAYPDPLLARIGRAARRHRLLVTAAAALLVTAVIALSISMALISQEKANTDAARARAVQNFRRARDVVNRFNLQMSRERLLNEPGLQPLREALAKEAADEFRRFVEEDGGDPEVQADYGKALMTLASVTNDIGSKSRAVEIIDEAIAVFQRLTREHPETRAYRTNLADCQIHKGAFYHSAGELPKAESAWLDALALFEQGSADAQPSRDDRNGLALVSNNLAQLYTAQGKFPQTEDNIRRAMTIREELAAEDSENGKYQSNLADTYGSRAALFFRTKHPEEAEKDLDAEYRIRQKLIDAHHSNVDYQNDLAASYNNRGTVYLRMGMRDKAVQSFQDALQVRSGVVERNPAVSQYRSELANIYRHLGIVYYNDLKRAVAAEQSWAMLGVLNRDAWAAGGAISAAAKKLAYHAGVENYGKALELSRRLARDYPQVPNFTINVGGDCTNLAILHDFAGRRDLALPLYSETITALESLPSEQRSADVRWFLARNYWGRAEILSERGERLKSLFDWKQALRIDKEKSLDGLRIEALSHAEQLREMNPWAALLTAGIGQMATPPGPTPAVLAATWHSEEFCQPILIGDLPYQVATLYCVLSAGAPDAAEAKLLTQRALEMLRRAWLVGYFKDRAHREQLHIDPDLEPLRSIQEFRDFLTIVEK